MIMFFERARISFDLIAGLFARVEDEQLASLKPLFKKSNANEEIVAYDGFVYDEAEVMA